jgi:hypothetical protein
MGLIFILFIGVLLAELMGLSILGVLSSGISDYSFIDTLVTFF